MNAERRTNHKVPSSKGGHFFFSKLFGVRVEKFYLFFDPWFHLFEFKPKNSDTTYGLGWLPLGGYCKISGMIDESFDTEQMKQPEQPYEFRSKPAWQRLRIMISWWVPRRASLRPSMAICIAIFLPLLV